MHSINPLDLSSPYMLKGLWYVDEQLYPESRGSISHTFQHLHQAQEFIATTKAKTYGKRIENICQCHRDVKIKAIEAAEKVALEALKHSRDHVFSNFIKALTAIFSTRES